MHIFDRDISVSENDSPGFDVEVSGNWSVNGTPNGGYLMALMASAMVRQGDMRSTPIVTANYISRCVPGRARIEVERISLTKQFNRMQAKLIQDGKEKVRANGTFSDEKNECFIERYETGAPDIAPLDACVPIPTMPKYTLMDNLDIRLDPECAGWMSGKLADRSEQKGWISFRDERPLDMLSILLIADSFPPPVFATQGLIAWVPTVELTVNVRNIPVTKWLKCTLRTRFITCGLLEEDGEVWDGEGNLVAISRQIAQFRKIGQ